MAPHVLVVEDDPKSTKLLELILGSEGYETSVASNGDDGLALLRSGEFDLLVLDLMLPGMDGFEVLREIRADADLCETPVVISSARAHAASQQEAAELGADVYLTKPYRKAELLDVVESLLARG